VTKDELRTQALRRRRAMSAGECHAASLLIAERAGAHPAVQKAHTIMAYVSRRGEVDTHELIRQWLREGRRVCVPRTEPATRVMQALAISDMDADLAPTGRLRILEPRPGHGLAVAPEAIDLHVIPGLLFDRDGRRLGHGAGYYDRFLSRAAPAAMRMALAFDWQIVDAIPAEPWDIAMRLIITESMTLEISAH